MFIKGFIIGSMLTLVVGVATILKRAKELAGEINEEIDKEN